MAIKREEMEMIDLTDITTGERLREVTPGEILQEEFLKPLNISQYRLSHAIGVHPRRINEIVHGTRGITADSALRLGRYFGVSAEFWINLQTGYDLRHSREQMRDTLEKIMPMAA